jgi:hypothetical protein
VTTYELPHVGHESLLLVWCQQPDELVPLISRHYENVPPWHLGNRPILRSRGSFLGRAIVWHPPRNSIGEFEDLAHGQSLFGGSAHRLPPKACRAWPVLWSELVGKDDANNSRF